MPSSRFLRRILEAANARPEFRTTAGRLFDKGLQQRSELEYHLGEDIAAIAQG